MLLSCRVHASLYYPFPSVSVSCFSFCFLFCCFCFSFSFSFCSNSRICLVLRFLFLFLFLLLFLLLFLVSFCSSRFCFSPSLSLSSFPRSHRCDLQPGPNRQVAKIPHVMYVYTLFVVLLPFVFVSQINTRQGTPDWQSGKEVLAHNTSCHLVSSVRTVN
jgi:hypothetical protein